MKLAFIFFKKIQVHEMFSVFSKDPFHEDRANLDPSMAHKSNFLHPVLYYYRHPVKGNVKNEERGEKEEQG